MKKYLTLLLALLLIITFASCGASGAKAFNWQPAADAVSVKAADPVGSVLMDNENCTVTVAKFDQNVKSTYGDFFAYQLTCKNKSDKNLIFSVSDLAVNGYAMSLNKQEQAAAKATVTLLVFAYYPPYDNSFVTKFEDFKTVEFTISAYDAGENGDGVVIYNKGEEPPKTFSAQAKVVVYPLGGDAQVSFEKDRPQNANVLIDDASVTLSVRQFGFVESIYGKFYGCTAVLYIENKTDNALTLSIKNVYIDGNKCADAVPEIGVSIVPGKHRTEWWVIFSDEGGKGVTQGGELKFNLVVKDSEGKQLSGYDKTFTVKAQK
ncbi:MAG: hypothetical protein GYA50_01640 [Eubacteriaceae bacterium]|nr:hypothetical protein [Eubacteriaceae bacterium]